jgi:hypothetical protein
LSIPRKNTPAWGAFLTDYHDATTNQKAIDLCKQYGFKSTDSMNRGLRKRELKPLNITDPLDMAIEHVPYPKFEIKQFKIGKTTRDVEDIGIVLADHHVAKITETYNISVYKQRMEYLLDSVMDIINLHRPIKRAFVFETGDMNQGENAFQGSKVGECACSAEEQIHGHSIPTQGRFLTSLASGVESVHVHGVKGNHGKYGKEANPNTNWDSMFYKSLAMSLMNQPNITVTPGGWCQLINIMGWRFFLAHFDQVVSQQGVPLIALRRKLNEWYAAFGGFHYAYGGHWHSGGHDQVNSMASFDICPPLVTGDEWALEKVGRVSKPIQLVFGIHPKYGRTWEYKLYTDPGFLPKVYKPEDGEIYFD